jgi:hypothetical protein
MHILDELKVIDGYFEGDRFIMRGISGHAIYGVYKAAGLSSLARLIHDNEPFSFTIDKDKVIHVPVELNKQLKKEMFLIAEELYKEEEN